MLTARIIACLDCKNGRVVKGVRFNDLKDAGDPSSLAERYQSQGADEIVILDVSATLEARRARLETVREVRERLGIPLTVGGGIDSSDAVAELLDAGADRVSVNTAAVARPELLAELAREFGSQCVVLAIDAKQIATPKDYIPAWRVATRSATHALDLDVVQWGRTATRLGVGEILLTSIDRDGTGLGYDVQLIEAVASAVSVPVIASGGAANIGHLRDALRAGASAALVASLLHFDQYTVEKIKEQLNLEGIMVRI